MEKKDYQIDKELISSLVETITHPSFTQFVSDIENHPSESRSEFAEKISTIVELEKRGVPIDKNFRICVRTFEDPSNPISSFDYKPEGFEGSNSTNKGTICASVGYVACLSYGIEK